MILTTLKYKIRKSNYKWKVGYVVFTKIINQHLEYKEQELLCLLMQKDDLDNPTLAREKFEKLLKVYNLEKQIKELKE